MSKASRVKGLTTMNFGSRCRVAVTAEQKARKLRIMQSRMRQPNFTPSPVSYSNMLAGDFTKTQRKYNRSIENMKVEQAPKGAAGLNFIYNVLARGCDVVNPTGVSCA